MNYVVHLYYVSGLKVYVAYYTELDYESYVDALYHPDVVFDSQTE